MPPQKKHIPITMQAVSRRLKCEGPYVLTQKQVREHTAYQAGLYDEGLVFGQCNNRNNQFDGVAKGSIQ